MKKLVMVTLLFFAVASSPNAARNYFAAFNIAPVDTPKFSISSSAGCDSNYIFLAATTSSAPYIMIIDNNGVPIFIKKTTGGVYDFKPQPNGTLSYFDLKMNRYYIMDKYYNIIDSVESMNGANTDLHELRILPNGNYLLLGWENHKVDMSKIVDGGSDSANVRAYVVQEIDKNKNVIFNWSTWDHFDITDTYFDLKQKTIDVAHGNSIDVDFDGNFLVSFRNTQEITKINRVTGEVTWRLGGKKNEFSFINDTLGFSWQHAARRLPNGNIILFDNGCKREPAIMSFSRALEYSVDEKNKTARFVWQYRNTPDVYSIGFGYSQRLANGNTFIAWGQAIPAVTEVTPFGKKVFELSFKDNYATYRAYRYPWKQQQITSGNNIVSTVNEMHFSVNSSDDTASVKVGLINNNPFPVVVTSITNKERLFYIPFEFPAVINANGSLVFRVYFRPSLTGNLTDTLKISTNYNNLDIPLYGEIKTGVVTNGNRANTGFTLEQNYPNPFNPTTVIGYRLPVAGHVSLKVFDLLGREVATLVDDFQQAGIYHSAFSALHLPAGRQGSAFSSGVYFYRLQCGSFSQTKKFVLMK